MPAKQRRGVNAAPALTTRRFNAHLRESAIQRLGVHALMSRQNPGEILSDLIDLHLKSWSLPSNLTDRASKRHNPSSVVSEAGHEQIPQIADAA
jgi:hypothetical protein